MSEFTPGPWDRDGADFIYGPDGKFIASLCLGSKPGDGPLIAAAPDMLAALETAVSTIEQLIPEPSARGVADVVLFQARAAIAKATGAPHPTLA